MYTAVVAGILLFPWTVVGVSILGWLAHRRQQNGTPSPASSHPVTGGKSTTSPGREGE